MLLLAAGGAAVAQSGRVAGRVVRISTGDTVPVGLVPLVLHRLGSASQGPIDTISADSRGRFAVRFPADTSALYLLSVRYQGIEYFSAPVRGDPAHPDTALMLIVADTSSTAPVDLSERTILIARPDESGSRMAIDWLVLANRGERTRVASDSVRPSWGARLPEDAQQVELADIHLSQFSPDAVSFRGDSVMVFAPISPGRKELVLQYRIPGGTRRLIIPAPDTDSVFVLLEEPEARVERPALVPGPSQQVEGRGFTRWAGVLGGASAIEVQFPPPGLSPSGVLPLLIAATALGFLALALLAFRGRRRARLLPDPVALADAIARLDLTLGREDLPPERRALLLSERARLLAILTRALAVRRRDS